MQRVVLGSLDGPPRTLGRRPSCRNVSSTTLPRHKSGRQSHESPGIRHSVEFVCRLPLGVSRFFPVVGGLPSRLPRPWSRDSKGRRLSLSLYPTHDDSGVAGNHPFPELLDPEGSCRVYEGTVADPSREDSPQGWRHLAFHGSRSPEGPLSTASHRVSSVDLTPSLLVRYGTPEGWGTSSHSRGRVRWGPRSVQPGVHDPDTHGLLPDTQGQSRPRTRPEDSVLRRPIPSGRNRTSAGSAGRECRQGAVHEE